MVCPCAASQPTTGQPRISCLATKPIMRWLCSASMSIQLTWLATNIVAPGSGVPTRRTRKPKMRISPRDHRRTATSPKLSSPTRIHTSSGDRHSRVIGRKSSRWMSSNGTRYA